MTQDSFTKGLLVFLPGLIITLTPFKQVGLKDAQAF